MGHLYPENFSRLLIDLLAQRGTTSWHELVKTANRRRMPVHCAEGEYREAYMREMACDIVVRWHLECGAIVPLPQTPAQRKAWRLFRAGNPTIDEWWDRGDPHHDLYRAWKSTPFRLAKRKRLEAIQHLDHVDM